jgi:hypothetical protein
MQTVPNALTDADPGLPVETCISTGAAVPAGPLGSPGSTQRTAITTALEGATIKGATPTHDAYRYSVNNIVAPAITTYPGDPAYVVLITDDAPDIALGCKGTGAEVAPKPTQPIIQEISDAWANYGMKTYIVGLPYHTGNSLTVDPRGWLSDAAIAGQTASAGCTSTGPNYCHLDLTQSTDLAASLAGTFQSISAGVMSCDFVVPPVAAGQPIYAQTINIVYQKAGNVNDAYLIPQTDTSCPIDASGAQQGWYLNPITGYITLCPSSCQMVQQDTKAVLNIRAGCGRPVVN